MWLRYLITLYAAVCVLDAKMDITCNKGEYLGYLKGGRQVCLPCEPGKFMSLDHHLKKSCAHCTRARKRSHEVIVESCTPTSDTVIGCGKGYFRENVIHLGLKTYGKCQKRTGNEFSCRRGEYRSDSLSGPYKCLPCPEGTFISIDKHTLRDCEYCTKADEAAHEILRSKCTRTSDAVVGCDDGYFRVSHDNYGMKSYGKCKKDVRAEVTCGEGEYVSTMEDTPTTCLPCPQGTFRSEKNHTSTSCSICTQANETSHEVTLKNCTPVSDAAIGCDVGYVRVKRMRNTNEQCEKYSTGASCSKGEYLSKKEGGSKPCFPCPPGTFNSMGNHQNTDCAPCTTAKDFRHEITLENCTSISDTVVGCEVGYVRKNQIRSGMKIYGECEIMPDAMTCGKGEYLSKLKTGSKLCLPCPSGTFVSIGDHTYEDCASCTEPEDNLDEIAIRPCTRTSDTIIGCKTGYYRVNVMPYGMKMEGECEKCSACEHFTITPCGMFTDTVCCSEPRVELVEANDLGHPNDIGNPSERFAICASSVLENL